MITNSIVSSEGGSLGGSGEGVIVISHPTDLKRLSLGVYMEGLGSGEGDVQGITSQFYRDEVMLLLF